MVNPIPPDVTQSLEHEEGGKMSFFEHLGELRKRIIHSAAAILLGAFVGFAVAKPVLAFIARPMVNWMRYELIVLDELCYVAMPETAAELLFQVIAGRAERAAVIVTTNLPFSEWTTMIPNARLCKAMVDRLTDQAHIIETGTESYRFRRTMAKNKGAKA